MYDNGQFKKGFKIIEKVLLETLYKVPFCSESYIDDVLNNMGFVKYRTQIHSFINMLPQTDIPIGEWVVEANKILNENDCDFKLIIDRNALNYSFPQLFVNEDIQISDRIFRYGTVHSVKGETFEAILLILKTRGLGSAYKTLLNKNISISESEELRIAYVGMTRPSKILVIAVPDEENKNAWENRLALR